MREESRQQLLWEIARRILMVSDPEQILLFDSQARGNASSESDFDVLVIEAVERPWQRSIEIRRALRGLRVPIDVIVATPRQIEQYHESPWLIYRRAFRDGQVLYERLPST